MGKKSQHYREVKKGREWKWFCSVYFSFVNFHPSSWLQQLGSTTILFHKCASYGYILPLDLLFCQIKPFINVSVAFIFGFQTLLLIDLTKIYQLKGLESKNKGHANFYECCDLTKKVYLTSILQQYNNVLMI